MKIKITDVAKFNPYHDAKGRFTTGSGATSFTIRTKDPAKQHLADRAVAREKERAQSAAKRNDDFHSIAGDIRYGEVQSQVETCSNKNVSRIWRDHFSDVGISLTNGNSKYNALLDRVYINHKDIDENDLEARNEALYHEVAHAIDHRMAKTLEGSRIWNTFSEKFEDGAFVKSLREEYKAIEKGYQKKLETERGKKVPIAEARAAMREELSYTYEETLNGTYRKQRDKKEWGNTWDIMQGCSKSKVQFPIGHDKSYYQGSSSDNHLAAEAFAEMYADTIANGKSLSNIKKHFPKSYEVFERMLGEM